MNRGATITFTGRLVVEHCCNCGVAFAIPEDMQRRLRESHDWFFCPAGHRQHYTGKTEAQKLRDELARERSLKDQVRARLQHMQGAMTDDRRRAVERAKWYAGNNGLLGAFWKGFDARTCGKCVEACPYDSDRGGFRRAWFRGYGEDDPRWSSSE